MNDYRNSDELTNMKLNSYDTFCLIHDIETKKVKKEDGKEVSYKNIKGNIYFNCALIYPVDEMNEIVEVYFQAINGQESIGYVWKFSRTKKGGPNTAYSEIYEMSKEKHTEHLLAVSIMREKGIV